MGKNRVRNMVKMFVLVLAALGLLLTTACNGNDPTPPAPSTSQEAPPTVGTAEAAGPSGQPMTIPRVTTADESQIPSVMSEEFIANCGKVITWTDFVGCELPEWYKKWITHWAGETGYDWPALERWAEKFADYDARAILKTYGISDDDARRLIAEKHGLSWDEVKRMHVVLHETITNTWNLEDERMDPFFDERDQVRLFLAPIVENPDGSFKHFRFDAGIFLSCFNDWWLSKIYVPPPPPPPPVVETCEDRGDCPQPPCKVNCGHEPPCKVNCGHEPPCKVNCGEEPPCKVNCVNDDKDPNKIPLPDMNGGQHNRPAPADTPPWKTEITPPRAGDPPPAYTPNPEPPPAPVPDSTPAPPAPPEPPAVGAPDPEEAPSECVNPPGMDVC